MKKIIYLIAAAALTTGLALSGTGCQSSGAVQGSLSEKDYASLQEAATACVTEEIAGDTTAATYKSYTAERLLEDKEIEKYPMPTAMRRNIRRT